MGKFKPSAHANCESCIGSKGGQKMSYSQKSSDQLLAGKRTVSLPFDPKSKGSSATKGFLAFFCWSSKADLSLTRASSPPLCVNFFSSCRIISSYLSYVSTHGKY